MVQLVSNSSHVNENVNAFDPECQWKLKSKRKGQGFLIPNVSEVEACGMHHSGKRKPQQIHM